MPLPLFPTEEGAPGDGNLIAIYGGSPATTEVLGGIIQYGQVAEVIPVTGVLFGQPELKKGHALHADSATIWLQGSLHLDIRGQPTVTDYADMLSRWDTVRAKLLDINYELFVYYRTASPATYRKYKNCNTHFIRSQWNNPVGISYLFAAVTTDKTLYATAPGA